MESGRPTEDVSAIQLFDWAELSYPTLFPSKTASGRIEFAGTVFDYRCYVGGNCLGVDFSGGVFGLGPFTGNALLQFGKTIDFTCRVLPDACAPPKVTSTVPLSNATDVPYRKPVITVAFSKTVVCPPSTSSAELGSLRGELTCSGQTVTIRSPDDWLPPNSTVQVSLRGVHDIGGNVITPFTWSFRTAASSLSARVTNDTGVVACVGASAPVDCADPRALAGQDALVGRDAIARAGGLSKLGVGNASFDFTKLDAHGVDLPNDASDWTCARDNTTGLVWEVKKTDGGLRDERWSYSWYEPDPTRSGGHIGFEQDADGVNWCGDTLAKCNTHAYVGAVNAAKLCGYTDWRLPAVWELVGITSYAGDWFDHGVDLQAFRSRPKDLWTVGFPAGVWTATPSTMCSSASWGKPCTTMERAYYLSLGWQPNVGKKSSSATVRLVRGSNLVAVARDYSPTLHEFANLGKQLCENSLPRSAPDARYVVHAANTVLDLETNLMWQRCRIGRSGDACEGTTRKVGYVEALQIATSSRYAGYSDWRVPNVKELLSLAEWACQQPFANQTIFPAIVDPYEPAAGGAGVTYRERQHLVSSTVHDVAGEKRALGLSVDDMVLIEDIYPVGSYLNSTAGVLLVRDNR